MWSVPEWVGCWCTPECSVVGVVELGDVVALVVLVTVEEVVFDDPPSSPHPESARIAPLAAAARTILLFILYSSPFFS